MEGGRREGGREDGGRYIIHKWMFINDKYFIDGRMISML